MTRPELSDNAIAELLQQVVGDIDRHHHPDRDGLRQRMLTEFDETLAGTPPEQHVGNSADVSRIHVDGGGIEEPRTPPTTLRRRVSWLVAACLLIAASTTVIFAVGSRDGRIATEPSVDLDIDDGTDGNTTNGDEEPDSEIDRVLVVDLDADLPQPLDADRVVFSSLGVSINGNPDFDVVEATADRVMLRPRSAEGSRGVTIQRIEPGVEPLDDLIDDARMAGHLTVQVSQVQIGAEFLSSSSLSMTRAGEEAFGCASNSPCLDLGPVSIWTDSVNELVELPETDGVRLWWVELGSSTLDLDMTESSQLLSSVEFVED